MIIAIDLFNNKFVFIRNESKKTPSFNSSKDIKYSLSTLTNKVKAINEVLEDEELVKELKKESNQLILSDDAISYDFSTFPLITKRKGDDIIVTRFRLGAPDHANYCLDYFVLNTTEKECTYYIEYTKISFIKELINVFNKHGIAISDYNTTSSLLLNGDKNNNYPMANLVVGEYKSELIIIKGNRIFGVNIIDYGSKTLLNGEYYLNSGYSFNNDESLSFAGLIAENIADRKEINDENILNVEKEKGLSYVEPKEMRLLKDSQLHQYNIKNNFRKLYARIVDLIDFYNKDPFYFPLKEVYVYGSINVSNSLIEASKEDKHMDFIYKEEPLEELFKKGIKHNPLFDKSLKKERRKIDWGKLLTMEIGKKKKD